ncbi:MAG: hypothetical protein K0B15_05925 [Lentimicrobium sp.]|nr:hypothetical protein [Lentimicrobium sp.]
MNNGRKFPEEWLKQGMFTFLLFMMVFPLLQSRFGLIKEKPLTGAFSAIAKPDPGSFTRPEWLSGVFQDEFNKRTENHIGFRNSLVRINNQIDYTFFRQANAEGVISGKNGELFEEDYIREAKGLFFIGDETWKKKAAQLKAVQDTLAVFGKTLVVIIEPGKATYYPELSPRKYRNIDSDGKLTNYGQMVHHFIKEGINLLDLDAYFRKMKNEVPHPLFLKGGTHWSYYGAALAADTTLAYLSGLSHKYIPDMTIEGIKNLDTIRHPDYDIGLAMNLIFSIRQEEPVYPVFSFDEKQTSEKADVLIVGDSFYFNWLNDQITPSAFSNCDFWYYNKNITRCDYLQDGIASDKNLRDEVLKRDIIMIMITGRFHHAFAWSFDEQLHELFFPEKRDHEWYFANQVRVYDAAFRQMVAEADSMQISNEQRINQEASYLFYKDYTENPEKYTRRHELVRLYSLGISSTPEWMEQIREKALKNGVDVDVQLRRDAEWMADEKLKNLNRE